MNCRLVFFAARKTALCERALQKSFLRLDLRLTDAVFSAAAETFRTELARAFGKCDLVFAVGGAGFDGKTGIKSAAENVLDKTAVTECKKIKNPDGDDGYLIRCASQLLIILPDEPQQIETIMRGVTGRYIETFANRR